MDRHYGELAHQLRVLVALRQKRDMLHAITTSKGLRAMDKHPHKAMGQDGAPNPIEIQPIVASITKDS